MLLLLAGGTYLLTMGTKHLFLLVSVVDSSWLSHQFAEKLIALQGGSMLCLSYLHKMV